MPKPFHRLILFLMLTLLFAMPALADIGDLFIDFDGTQFSVSFIAEPETTPALLMLDELTLSGVSVVPNVDDFSGTWIGYPDGEPSSKSCMFSVSLHDIRLASQEDNAAWAAVIEGAQTEPIEAFFMISMRTPKVEEHDLDAFISSFDAAQAPAQDETMEVIDQFAIQFPLASIETPNDGSCPLIGLPEEMDEQNP